MSFWSSQKLQSKVESDNLIEPYSQSAIRSAAYELSLGGEYFLTSDPDNTKDKLESHEQVSIPPGQFGLLITEETVTVPLNAIAFISIRAGVKFRGLVNISGFHVDPGFSGKLKFSVYNAGAQSIVLHRHQKVFLMWFADLEQNISDGYCGPHQNQMQITGEDVMRIQGEIASPAALAKRIADLESNFKLYGSIVIAVLLMFLGAIVKGYVETNAAKTQPSSQSSNNSESGNARETKVVNPPVEPSKETADEEGAMTTKSGLNDMKKN